MNLTPFIVRSQTTKVIDVAASTALFTEALDALVASQAADQDSVADAVDAVFDENRGSSITLPNLGSLVAARLNAGLQSTVVSKRAQDFVRANRDRFEIRKGAKTGGVRRLSDVSAS